MVDARKSKVVEAPGERQAEERVGVEALTLDRVRYLIDQLKSVMPALDELAEISDKTKQDIQRQIADYALSVKTAKLKPEELEGFFKKPYALMPTPGRQDSWYLIIPRFVDVSFGWLHQQTESFNIFLINRYVDWLGELPEVIKRELGFKPPPDLKLDGEILSGPPRALEEAWRKYRPFLKDRDEKRIVINKRRSFELIASLVKDGVLPFTPKPVDPSDLVERKLDFELRPYQREAWEVFKRYSNTGVFFPASTGKTVLGLHLMTHLKPPHLVVVPSIILKEQWERRIEAHTDLKPEEYTVCTYHTAIKKYANKEWTSLCIDEVHHLPSNWFSKLSFIKRKYTLGLSATPQREDGREEFIFALTGFPVGLGWQHFRQLGIIKSPECHVWIVKDFTAKLTRLKALIDPEVKTIIFSDSIEIGKLISKRFDVPHVFGQTRGRLEVIEKSPVAVVSRVGDEGISLPTVGKVIEVSWLFGSRRQELQRFTRLLHGFDIKGEGEHHILMTLDEYLHDRKRLFSVMDKGFKVQIHREGVSERAVERRLTEAWRPPRIAEPRKREAAPAAMPIEAAPQGPVAEVMNLPGVQRIMQRLSKSEQRFWSLLLQNDGSWFRRDKLPLLLGYTSEDSMRHSIRFDDMVARGCIEQMKIEGKLAYRTNVRARMG